MQPIVLKGRLARPVTAHRKRKLEEADLRRLVGNLRLETLPRIGTMDSVTHGLPHVDTRPFDGTPWMTAAAENAPIYDVMLDDVIATQPSVYRWRVRDFINGLEVPQGHRDSGRGNLPDEIPTIVRVLDRLFLVDGHHRAAAARLMGYESIPARVITPAFFG